MDEMKKDHKNAALWSFILGLIEFLFLILSVIRLPSINIGIPIEKVLLFYTNTDVLSLLILILSVPASLTGLVLGIKGINSSRKTLSIIGIILCTIELIGIVYASFMLYRLIYAFSRI